MTRGVQSPNLVKIVDFHSTKGGYAACFDWMTIHIYKH